MTDELLAKAAVLKKRREAIKDALKEIKNCAGCKTSTCYDAGKAMNHIENLGGQDELHCDFFSQLCEFIEVNLQTRLEEVQEEYANL